LAKKKLLAQISEKIHKKEGVSNIHRFAEKSFVRELFTVLVVLVQGGKLSC